MISTSASISENHPSGTWQPDREGLVSAASFWTPIRAGVGSGWIEHAPFAFWLVDALRPRCFAELGSYMGYSYSAICQAVQRLDADTVCYAIDTWQGDDHAGFYGESVFDDLQAFNAQHFSSFSRLVRATFSDASRHFADGSVDLLHIDGRHGYEDVKADYEEWEPKLAPGAVVLFHDTNVHERGFGVFRFWSEISRDRPHFEFLHGNGLGVLGSQQTESPQLRALFAAAGDEALTTELRTAYARLGGALTDVYALQSLKVDAAAAQGTAREQQSRLAELQRERDAFEAGCRERDAVVMGLQEQATDLAREKAAFEAGCRERDAVVAGLQEQATDLAREKAAFEAGCRERDTVVAGLQEQATDLAREKAAFETGCRERDAVVAGLQERATDLAREKAAFEDGCRERDTEIIRLRLQIAELISPSETGEESKEAALVAALRDQIATHDRELARLMGTVRLGHSAA